ncbi:hypothetical protein GCM10023093_17120 [Nemorincola caseinilytica]|uniref:Uncharacterized protein n=1 Tax=Nemorincola caseinilytica TaxID=2054315 RepID=A0ABP8NDG9_9BACT
MNLHKRIDFGQPGGFPLTQNRLADLQTAYTEALLAIIAAGGDIVGPLRLSGMELTTPSPGTTAVSAGYFVYNGNLVRFEGGSVTPGEDDEVAIVISHPAEDLTYNDGVERPVLLRTIATLVAEEPAGMDDTRFPIMLFNPWGRIGWAGGYMMSSPLEGTVLYRKDLFSNVVALKGNVSISNISPATELPAIGFLTFWTLPEGYRPEEDAYFVGHFIDPASGGNYPRNSMDYLRHFTCRLTTAGEVQVEFINDDGAFPAGYSVTFNARLNLG